MKTRGFFLTSAVCLLWAVGVFGTEYADYVDFTFPAVSGPLAPAGVTVYLPPESGSNWTEPGVGWIHFKHVIGQRRIAGDNDGTLISLGSRAARLTATQWRAAVGFDGRGACTQQGQSTLRAQGVFELSNRFVLDIAADEPINRKNV